MRPGGKELYDPQAKKNGWSAHGKLKTGDKLTQLTLQCNFEDRPETYVVEFNKFSTDLNSDFPIRAEAYLTWSVEGNSVTRRVSLVNGTTIQGVAQAVRVVIVDATKTLPGATPIEYEVSFQCTVGTRGSNKFPPFLITADSSNLLNAITPGVNIPVPQDAGAISINIQAIGIGGGGPFDFIPLLPGTLFVIMEQNGAFISFTEYQGPAEIVPIVPGTDTIRVVSKLAADPLLTAIETVVMFGIDG
jgi:hypothetical protein